MLPLLSFLSNKCVFDRGQGLEGEQRIQGSDSCE